MKYLSEEWFEKVSVNICKLLNKPGKYSFSFVEVCEGRPGGEPDAWLMFNVDKGIVTKVTHGCGAVPAADLRAFGKYADHVRVCKKELDPKTAVVKDVFRIEKNIKTNPIMILSFVSMYQALVEAKQLPGVEY